MRSVTIRLSTARGWFDPFDKVVMETAGIEREAIHEMRLVNDGSAVMLYEYSGDREQIESLVRQHLEQEHVSCQISEVSGNLLVYATGKPNATVRGLLWAVDEWKFVIDAPMRFGPNGELIVTLIGDEYEIRDALSNLPEDVRVRIERTGDFEPERDQILQKLTERERETLRVAIDMGYYQNPRQASYDDIAGAIGRTKGTVGTHLRNAETKVMATLFHNRLDTGTDDDDSRIATIAE